MPATTVTDLDRRLITDTVFALSYPLAPPRKVRTGPIVGGVVGGFFLLSLGAALLYRRKRLQRQAKLAPALECRQAEVDEIAPPPPPPPKTGTRDPAFGGYYGPVDNGEKRAPQATGSPPQYHEAHLNMAELDPMGSRVHPSESALPLQGSDTASISVDEDIVISPLSKGR